MTVKLKLFASGPLLAATLLGTSLLATGAAHAQITSRSLSAPAEPAPLGGSLSSSLSLGGVAGSVGPVQPAPRAAPAPAPVAAPRPSVLRASVAAVVNDEPITSFDVTQRVLWFIVTTGVQPTEQNISQLQEDALDALIDEHLQAQELRKRAKDRKMPEEAMFVQPEEVDEYLDAIAGENRLTRQQFLAQLTARGLTETSVREQMKMQLSWRDYIRRYYGSRIKVGDDQIRQTVDRISAEASKPSYLTSEIFIDANRTGGLENAKTSAQQRLQQLQQNARFDALARQFSSLPSAAKGGDAGWQTSGEFPPEVERALSEMTPGQIRPVTVKDGVYLILLQEKKAGGGASTVMTLKQAAVPLTAGNDQAARAKLAQVRTRATSCSNLAQAAQAAGVQVDDLGQTDIAILQPAVRDAIKDLRAGQFSAPVSSGQQMHLLAVCDRRASGADVPSNDEVRNRLFIEQITMLQRRSLRDLRQSATISQP